MGKRRARMALIRARRSSPRSPGGLLGPRSRAWAPPDAQALRATAASARESSPRPAAPVSAKTDQRQTRGLQSWPSSRRSGVKLTYPVSGRSFSRYGSVRYNNGMLGWVALHLADLDTVAGPYLQFSDRSLPIVTPARHPCIVPKHVQVLARWGYQRVRADSRG